MLADTAFRILALVILFSAALSIRWLWRWLSHKPGQL